MRVNRKTLIGLIAFFICLLSSFAIQKFSAPLYPQALAKVEQVEIQGDKQVVKARKINGGDRGEKIELSAKYRQNELDATVLHKGDQVFYSNRQVGEKKRDGFVFFLLIFLFLILVFIGGKVGLTAFISVILNSGALFLIVDLYRHHTQFSLLLFTAVYAVLSIGITLFLIDGIRKNSLQKFLATTLTVFTAYLICWSVITLFSDKGLRFEDMGVLTRPYRPVFLAGLLIGAVGASLDTVVTVISTLEEIRSKDPQLTIKELIRSGRAVGKDIRQL